MNKKAHKAKLEQAIRHVHVSVSRRGDERTITNDHERSRRVAPCLSIVRISLDLVSHWGAGVGDGKRTRHLEILNDIEALLLQDTPPLRLYTRDGAFSRRSPRRGRVALGHPPS